MNIDELLQQEYPRQIDILEERPSRSRMRDLETILTVVRKINTSLVLSDVLELVLDESIRITKAERGFLMLAEKDRVLKFAVGRNAGGKSIHAESFQVSTSVLEDVFTTGESLCIENALTDERFERRQSIMNLELQTIICSPLRTQDEKVGVIYVDSKYIQAVDKADILYLFEILAGQAAIAIKNARLYHDLKTTYDDLKHANEQIIKSERMAMKGEIAGEVSHELKNMVAVVLLQLQVLQRRIDGITPEEIRSIIDKTLEGARKIQGFSQSLLTRSRASDKLLPAKPNDIARNFIDFVKVLPKFKRNEVSLILAEDVPELEMDVDQIQQVLLNLVNNAVEACAETAIVLQTEYDITENVVRISVKDSGPGIDEEIRNKLFNQKITTKADGHGYGLPICRQLVEHHGGTIRIESKKNEGAKFIMTFPVRKSSDVTAG
ncbi:MAG: Histidine kinase protein [Bacteroidetes bacterium]|nr:Histidine kinase protein [Bacteroidota bacterium]